MAKIIGIVFLMLFAVIAFGIVFIILKIDNGYTKLIKQIEQELEKENKQNLKNN